MWIHFYQMFFLNTVYVWLWRHYCAEIHIETYCYVCVRMLKNLRLRRMALRKTVFCTAEDGILHCERPCFAL